jgi:hypothetical protein
MLFKILLPGFSCLGVINILRGFDLFVFWWSVIFFLSLFVNIVNVVNGGIEELGYFVGISNLK